MYLFVKGALAKGNKGVRVEVHHMLFLQEQQCVHNLLFFLYSFFFLASSTTFCKPVLMWIKYQTPLRPIIFQYLHIIVGNVVIQMASTRNIVIVSPSKGVYVLSISVCVGATIITCNFLFTSPSSPSISLVSNNNQSTFSKLEFTNVLLFNFQTLSSGSACFLLF